MTFLHLSIERLEVTSLYIFLRDTDADIHKSLPNQHHSMLHTVFVYTHIILYCTFYMIAQTHGDTRM